MSQADATRGRGWAREVLVAGGVAVALGVVLRAQADGRHTRTCSERMRHMSVAMLQYVRDYDEKYPMANWSEALRPYAKVPPEGSAAFAVCPTTGNPFAMHGSFAGHLLSQSNDVRAPLLFEVTRRERDSFDDGSHWPRGGVHQQQWRGTGGAHYAQVDGHVKFSTERPPFELARPMSRSVLERKTSP